MSAEMTIILLNYKRPKHIPIILDSIRRQTVKPVIFLWNNGDDDVNSPEIDRYEKSPHNVGCMARWFLAREADTPFVMSLDDDFCFGRDDALEDIIRLLRESDDPARIIGPTGCTFFDEPIYTKRKDIYTKYVRANTGVINVPEAGHIEVDVVKGRSMAFRRNLLDDVELPYEREDDIFLSAQFANGRRRFHRVPRRLDFAFRELPELGLGNWKKPYHMESRIRATEKYFGRPCQESVLRSSENSSMSGQLSSILSHGSWKPRRRGMIYRGVGDRVTLQIDDTNQALLNPVAANIWELCDGRRNPEAILAELCEIYNTPESVLWPDLRNTLSNLTDIGALEPGSTAAHVSGSKLNRGLRIRLGLVSETRHGFINQVKLCLYSLRKNGGALSNVPVTLITNSQPIGAQDANFLREHFSPIEFKTSPRLGAIPHTSKLNVFYSIDPSSYDILMFMDCDTVVRNSLDQIVSPFLQDEDVQFVCRRGGESDRNSFVDFDSMVARFCGQGCPNKIDFEGQEEWPMFNSGVFLATSEAVTRIRRNAVDFTYRIFNEWQRTDALEKLPEHLKSQVEYRKDVTASWPIEQGALALSCIKSGVKVQYLDGLYNSWGGEEDFMILHCFKSLYKFDRPKMFDEKSDSWIQEYLVSDIPGKRFLGAIVRDYKRKFVSRNSSQG